MNNSNTLLDLKKRHDSILDEIRTIITAAEGRGLNDEERAKLDGLETEENQVRKDIRRFELASSFLSGVTNQERGGAVVLSRSEKFADAVRTTGDERNLSLGRLLRGYIVGDWTDAEAEMRAMASTPSSAGGILIPTVLSARVVDRARNAAAVFKAGASTVPMTSNNLTIARLTTDPTAAWYAENGTITESDAAFDSVQFTARKMATLVRISNELLADAQNIDMVVEEAIGQAIAHEIDRVCLLGSGTAPEPRGIANVAGAHTVTAVGSPSSYDAFLTAIYKVRGSNLEPNAAIYSSRTGESLAKLKTGITNDKTPLQMPTDWAALQRFVSNQVPINLGAGTNESLSFVGQWNELMVGLRQNIQLEVSREAGDVFAKDQSLIRATWRGDVKLAHDTAFCVMSGILA